MRHNRLRALLTADQPSLGTHLLSSWPTLVELVGDAGNYDYVEFTAEYAPFHMHDLDNLGRALELKNLGGMIKIEQTQWTHQAMRAIGSGFQEVLFADLRTVADAAACVAAVRAETPGTGGRLGVGMRRDVGTVREVRELIEWPSIGRVYERFSLHSKPNRMRLDRMLRAQDRNVERTNRAVDWIAE